MKKLLIALFVFALGMMITNNVAYGQSAAGTVSIDSVSAQRGEQIAVGVRLAGNTKDIAGLLLPIKYSTANLNLDSVSFLGTVLTSDYSGFVDSFSFQDIIKITYIPTTIETPLPFLQTPNGLLATLFFTVKNSALPGNFGIDSVNIVDQIGSTTFETKCYTVDPDGQTTYYPDFRNGNVAILVPTDVNDGINSSLPTEFTLAQNYPNPFNPSTVIGFSLPTASSVKLEIFNVLGQKVTTLASGRYAAGNYSFEFDASDHPSGVFFYRLTHDNGVETRKMILIK